MHQNDGKSSYLQSIKKRVKDLVNSSTHQPEENFDSSSSNKMSCSEIDDNLNDEEKLILEKVRQQNRLLEADTKSLKSISEKRNASSQNSPSNENNSEELKIQKWEQIITKWNDFNKNKPKLKEIIRKGIPNSYRKLLWPLLCEADSFHVNVSYVELLKKSSPSEKLIKRDITRTYPEEKFFKNKNGQSVLFNVIKAYSLVDREVGYCQGSAFIAGLLLMHLPEEDSFQVFVSLMHSYGLRELFKPSMSYLGLCMYQFELLLQEHCNDLYVHMQAQAFHTSSFASSWFLTLMATTFDTNLSARILDVFISEGIEIIFRLGLTILLDNKEKLLNMDMEKMLRLVHKEVPIYYNSNQDVLFEKAYKLVKYNPKKMKKWEKDYLETRSKETEDMIEMRTLKTENRLLLQKVQNFEEENLNLADKLIQERLNRAIDAEDKIRLQKELAIAKRQGKIDKSRSTEEKNDDNIVENKIGNSFDSKSMDSSKSDVSSKSIGSSGNYTKELEEQLVLLKNKEAELEDKFSSLKEKCVDLSERNRELTDQSRVRELEEELVATKLREAESCSLLKELKQNVSVLNNNFNKHLEKMNSSMSQTFNFTTNKQNKSIILDLQQQVMQMRIQHQQVLLNNAEFKQQITLLETSNHSCKVQLHRSEEEISVLRDAMDAHEKTKMVCKHQINQYQDKVATMESQLKECVNKLKIEKMEIEMKEVEFQQTVENLMNKHKDASSAANRNIHNNNKCLQDGQPATTTNHDGSGDTSHVPIEIIEPDKSAKLIRKLQRKILRQQKLIDKMAEEDYEQHITRSNCDIRIGSSTDEKSSSTEDSDSELVFKPKIDDDLALTL